MNDWSKRWVRRCRWGVAGVELNLDLVLGLAHLHAAPDPVHWNRIAVAVQRDIPFDIHQALMQPVDFRNPGGVFRLLRYDNLTSAVKKILRGYQREETTRFVAFRSH